LSPKMSARCDGTLAYFLLIAVLCDSVERIGAYPLSPQDAVGEPCALRFPTPEPSKAVEREKRQGGARTLDISDVEEDEFKEIDGKLMEKFES